MPTGTLAVSEVFGPTIQGEGPHMGRVCGFLRLGACNLTCGWCDTPYTWDASRYDLKAEITRRPIGDLADEIAAMGVSMLVLTGGEPLLQQGPDLDAFLIEMAALEVAVHVETNGTKKPTPNTNAGVTHYSVSPKLANSGVAYAKRIRPEALTWFSDHARQTSKGPYTPRVAFKFVARDTTDLDEIDALVAEYRIPTSALWVMGEGQDPLTNSGSLLAVADAVIARGWNLTPRLHTLLWGTTRGV